MRGQQERSGSLFSYISIEERISSRQPLQPLRQIRRLADHGMEHCCRAGHPMLHWSGSTTRMIPLLQPASLVKDSIRRNPRRSVPGEICVASGSATTLTAPAAIPRRGSAAKRSVLTRDTTPMGSSKRCRCSVFLQGKLWKTAIIKHGRAKKSCHASR